MAEPQPVKVPPTFKSLLPFIRRAEELDRDTSRPESKLIAYFCRQYAMELGIKLRENDPSNESTDYLLSLMDRLEYEKNKLPEFSQEEGKEICEDFALEIFSKADDEDQTGMANKSTARTFYAAGTFFDILNQFGEISDDTLEKRRYSRYKAATILKAIKEGIKPTPGPQEELDLKVDNKNDYVMPASSTSTHVFSTLEPLAPAFVHPPMQDIKPTLRSAHSPSVTESTRSAGVMQASELDSIWHGPTSAEPYRTISASSHSAPAAPQSSVYPASKESPAPSGLTSIFELPSAPTPADKHSPELLPPFRRQPFTTPQSTSTCERDTPVSQNEITDAIEYAKFAIAALKVKDTKLAEERLKKALCIIQGA
ncbi:uncharacterized protein CCR75_008914 [Bremia lactucae]|uniref:Vta1/callose synthase N-terminal domain-containing protein n=1 Tax=Bremia lactucae TaxID=4779 RepID=A0A976FE66_BRELC|nr:hypothetical protein CCR75_008914 [Bremia lactucae]